MGTATGALLGSTSLTSTIVGVAIGFGLPVAAGIVAGAAAVALLAFGAEKLVEGIVDEIQMLARMIRQYLLVIIWSLPATMVMGRGHPQRWPKIWQRQQELLGEGTKSRQEMKFMGWIL
ncbi:hypothetical protein DA792_14625 [Celeribacter baekdonensis]|uniref:Uncharacterized protein n=1 Tax=Celeribacter baekdonensis TaxID=875171 RepID=A0A2R4M4M9_9RHOB|nr:hypothetical protein DA792_14625 [Celeribacter baekdonensis]